MWQNSIQCSRSCGGGNQQQSRSCTNPVTQCGGLECVGSNSRVVSCNKQCCPGKV